MTQGRRRFPPLPTIPALTGGAFFALAAHAEPCAIEGVGGGGDSLELRRGAVFVELVYGNTGRKNSNEGTFTLSCHGVTVEVEIKVGSAGPETIWVRPDDPQTIAEPEFLDVPDGAYGVILLIPPMG